jgi:hypothetical protein
VPSEPNRDDVLTIVERIVSGAEHAGDKLVDLNIHFARFVLDLAKCAPRAHSRPPLSGRDKVARSMMIKQARRRKADLVAQGVPKGMASDQAAEEAARASEGKRHNLAASTIKRMMQIR